MGRDEHTHDMRHRFLFVAAATCLCLVLTGGIQGVHAVRLRGYEGVAPICRVETTRRAVALTFDDGPDPRYTDEVLELLAEHGARATFFVVGERAAAHPTELDAILAGGNELGNHTWSHARLSDLSGSDALAQVGRARELLVPLGGSTLVRAPYGDVRAETLEDLRPEGLTPVHWSIALDHYVGDTRLTPREVATTIAADIRPGDIILAHDASDGGIEREHAMAVLRVLLPLLQARGLEVTTAGDLLRSGKPVSAVPRPWVWQSGFSCPDA